MADKEMVLDLGVEGGGATVFRTPLGSGGWEFLVRGRSIDIDENDDEQWRSWESQPYLRIEGAVRSISKGGGWVFFYPISIHPDYRTAVWELVQDAASKLPDGQKKMWDCQRGNWQERCQQGS